MKPGNAQPPLASGFAGLVDGLEMHDLQIEPGDSMTVERLIELLKQVPTDTRVYAFDHDACGVARCRRVVRLFLSVDPQLIVVW